MTHAEKLDQCRMRILDEMCLVVQDRKPAITAKAHIVGEGFPKDMVDAEWKKLAGEIVAMLREQEGGSDGKSKKQD